MAKAKAGKKAKKAAVRKPAARRAAPAATAAKQDAQPKALTFPCDVMVHKGEERIPVQVTDEAHYQRLVATYGDGHVQVQS